MDFTEWEVSCIFLYSILDVLSFPLAPFCCLLFFGHLCGAKPESMKAVISGTYWVDTPIIIASNVQIIGAGNKDQ